MSDLDELIKLLNTSKPWFSYNDKLEFFLEDFDVLSITCFMEGNIFASRFSNRFK